MAIPKREAELVTWSLNFTTLTTAGPTDYGLTAPQATAYAARHDAFVAAYNTANSDSTRTPSAIITKDEAMAALLAEARALAAIVQSCPTVTNAQRNDLGLTVRDAEPSPVPPPAAAPQVVVKSVDGRTARIRLIDAANPTRRGKPAGAFGAAVFSFVGEAVPPANLADWKFEGNTGRTTIDVVFPDTVAKGATVWLSAFWFNARKQAGPACDPVSANLPGGSVSQAA